MLSKATNRIRKLYSAKGLSDERRNKNLSFEWQLPLKIGIKRICRFGIKNRDKSDREGMRHPLILVCLGIEAMVKIFEQNYRFIRN